MTAKLLRLRKIGSRLFLSGLASSVCLTACADVGDFQNEVVGEQTQPLKLSATATASSQESASLGAGNAVDGNTTTRWSSAFSDPQWIKLDLPAA